MKHFILFIFALGLVGCSSTKEIKIPDSQIIPPEQIQKIVEPPKIIEKELVVKSPAKEDLTVTVEPPVIEAVEKSIKRAVIKQKIAKKQPVTEVEKQESELKDGTVAYNIPDKMFKGREEKISVSIYSGLSPDQIKEIKEKTKESIKVGALMTAVLLSPDESFKIVEISSKDQVIIDGKATTWNWSVTPLKHGNQKLILQIAVRYKIGKNTERYDYPVYNKEILVETSLTNRFKDFFTKWGDKIIGAILGTGVMGWLGSRMFKKEETNEKE